jgi:serine/threonine protein kinase
MTPLFCRNCGTRLPTDSLFCSKCGTSQIANDHTPTNLAEQEPPIVGTGRMPPGRMLHQRYRLLHTIGQGGMGAVYVAQDTQLGDRLIAVKEMSMSRLTPQELPHAVEQFRSEAHLLASLHHPNLPVIHEYFSENDRWYLVMSFIEGQNLQTALDSAPSKKLPLKDAIHIGIELCEVLDYLHSHVPQIIFRDLKPSNIMLTPKGHICLIDFGIARHFKQEQTKDTAYYYSVGYAPPEQYGQSQTGPRSDIYSLGATLHQMLSGQNPANKPFQFSPLQLVDATIPVPLAKLIAQMLEMNEQSRPASVAEVEAQMEKVLIPEQIEPPQEVGSEQQEHIRKEPVSLTQSTFRDTGQISQSLWSKIDRFFAERRIAAWLCFVTLILIIGWGTGSSLLLLDVSHEFGQLPGISLEVASTGAALVGLIFLRAKRQSLVDIIGGITLTAFGSLALLTFISYTVHINILLYSAIILLISLPLYSLGTRFFLRSANMIGGFIFGIFLIIVSLILAVNTLNPLWHDIMGGASNAMYAGWLIWLQPAILGIVAIIVTLLNGQRNKHQSQNRGK